MIGYYYCSLSTFLSIIKNKYVNEVDNREVSDLSDPEYQDQVISVIK